MRCTHCGYHSFDELSTCKKCGKPLLARYAPGVLPDAKQPSLFGSEAHGLGPRRPEKTRGILHGLPPLHHTHHDLDKHPGAEQPTLPSFLLDDPHVTTNNWDGWSCGETDSETQCLLVRRLMATLIDGVTIVAILALFAWVSWEIMLWTPTQWLELFRQQALVRLAYYLLIMLLIFSYFFLGHYGNGQTLGKALLRLQVVDVEGGSLSMAQVVLRSTGSVLSLLCFGCGFVATWRDVDQRGWSDRLAGTRVVAVADTCSEETEAEVLTTEELS
ncbi:MAG: hypothetical protein C0620_04205 [Desulfuromonas sp.]|nr:MAG: hypothetical protein C0620_04205 [Desulfuromonas sp.]